jgi:DNA-binding response OmpR family regulator
MGCMTHDDAATILLVEDDDATRTFLADNLTADGYDLLVADCVSDGLRLLERKFPDAALSISACPTPAATSCCAACAPPTASPAASTRTRR